MKKIFLITFFIFHFSKPVLAAQNNFLEYDINDQINWRQDQVSASRVRETYTFDEAADKVTITFNFKDASGNPTTGFSPLPPMLALARSFNFQFDVKNGGTTITSEERGTKKIFGPLIGIPNSSSFSVEITGLKKYVLSQRNPGTSSIPQSLQNDLVSEVEKIISAGHLRPALFLQNAPGCYSSGCDERGIVYWWMPGEPLQYLSEILPLLPTSPVNYQSQVKTYLTTERNLNRPESVKAMSFSAGTSRFISPHSNELMNIWEKGDGGGQDNWNNMVWFRTRSQSPSYPKNIYNLYGLAKFYEATNTAPTATEMNNINTLVADYYDVNNTSNFAVRDFATMYFKSNHWPEFNAVHAVNQQFAGLVGYIKLARLANDTGAQNLGWGLLAKTAALRLAMAKYTQYSSGSGYIGTQSDGSWWAKQRANQASGDQSLYPSRWMQELISFKWFQPIQNVRQVHRLDDRGIDLREWFSWGIDADGLKDTFGQLKLSHGAMESAYGPYLLPFADLTPELGRFMKDKMTAEVQAFADRVVENQTNWYMAFNDSIAGRENGYAAPSDSYGLFLAHAWVLGDTPATLSNYIDFPWTQKGDFFYLSKLAETMRAYRGDTWSDQPTASPVPSPTPAFTITQLKTLFLNWLGIDDSQYHSIDSKINSLDASWVIKWLVP